MACMSCFSGLFSSAKQTEKPKEDLGVGCGTVDEEQPLTEPAEAAGAPADKGLANEAEGSPSTAAQADLEEPLKEPLETPEPEPATEPATLAHFEDSDAEDGAKGKAPKGCCVPRAGRRRNKSSKAVKCADQEATPTGDSAKADDSPQVADKTTASAGA